MTEGLSPLGYTFLRFPSSRLVLWDRTPIGKTLYINPQDFLARVSLSRPALLSLLSAPSPDPLIARGAAGDAPSRTQRRTVHVSDIVPLSMSDSAGGCGACVAVVRTWTLGPVGVGPDVGGLERAYRGGCGATEPYVCVSQVTPLEIVPFPTAPRRLHLSIHHLLPSSPLTLTPLNLLRILPTALSDSASRGLGSQGPDRPAFGFLTLDQARRLVLLQPSEPRLLETPVVGVWVAGAGSPTSAAVWAACCRFIAHPHLKDRATMGAGEGAFLCLLLAQPGGGVGATPQLFEASFSVGPLGAPRVFSADVDVHVSEEGAEEGEGMVWVESPDPTSIKGLGAPPPVVHSGPAPPRGGLFSSPHPPPSLSIDETSEDVPRTGAPSPSPFRHRAPEPTPTPHIPAASRPHAPPPSALTAPPQVPRLAPAPFSFTPGGEGAGAGFPAPAAAGPPVTAGTAAVLRVAAEVSFSAAAGPAPAPPGAASNSLNSLTSLPQPGWAAAAAASNPAAPGLVDPRILLVLQQQQLRAMQEHIERLERRLAEVSAAAPLHPQPGPPQPQQTQAQLEPPPAPPAPAPVPDPDQSFASTASGAGGYGGEGQTVNESLSAMSVMSDDAAPAPQPAARVPAVVLSTGAGGEGGEGAAARAAARAAAAAAADDSLAALDETYGLDESMDVGVGVGGHEEDMGSRWMLEPQVLRAAVDLSWVSGAGPGQAFPRRPAPPRGSQALDGIPRIRFEPLDDLSGAESDEDEPGSEIARRYLSDPSFVARVARGADPDLMALVQRRRVG